MRCEEFLSSAAESSASFGIEETDFNWRVRARCGSEETFLKLDTGSKFSQLPFDFVESAGLLRAMKPSVRKNVKYPFKSNTVRGRITLNLRLGSGAAFTRIRHEYLVINRSTGLLGLDFLHKYACKVNLSRKIPMISLRRTP